MRVSRSSLLLPLLLLALASGCLGSATAETGANVYMAVLSGRNERPTPVVTGASGTATLLVSGATATYSVQASGFGSALVVGSLNVGSMESSGPAVVPLAIIAQSGTVASGTIDLSRPVVHNTLTIAGDSLRRLLANGLVYVNLYTTAYPDGEIRGQLLAAGNLRTAAGFIP